MVTTDSTRTSAPAPTRRAWLPWLGFVTRQVLGWVLLVAGVLKIMDVTGTASNVRAYQWPLPFWMTETIAWVMPVLEIVVGLMLVLGLFTRVAGALGALAMLVFVVAIASVWARGIAIDCGCFGTGGAKPTIDPWLYFWEIVRDVALMACGLFLVWRPRTPLALDQWLLGPVPLTHTDNTDTDLDEESDR